MRTFVLMAVAMLMTRSLESQSPTVPSSVVPVLSTSGQGEAKVSPDRAAVQVDVQTRALTAAAAAAENAKRVRAVYDAMARLGLPKDKVTTQGYTVYPEMQYNRDGSSPRVTGYVANNTVRVETVQVDQAGAIIDAALAAGANLINGISFYASSIEQARRDAMASAVSSARADADAMARAAGGTVGDLLELSTGGPTAPPRPMYELAMKSAAQGAPTPVNPGQQTVTVYVAARWRFIPAR